MDREPKLFGKKIKGAGVAFLGALSLLGLPGNAGAQSAPDRSFYFNRDPELPLAENIRRFNQMQARRRSGEISDDCMEIIAITERQLRAGHYPEYLYEDVPSCSEKEFERLIALDPRGITLERWGQQRREEREPE